MVYIVLRPLSTNFLYCPNGIKVLLFSANDHKLLHMTLSLPKAHD